MRLPFGGCLATNHVNTTPQGATGQATAKVTK